MVLEHAKEGHAEIHRPERPRTGRFMTVAVVEGLKEYGRFLDECVK